MSHILKALRKSQMERELGQIPSIGVSAPGEPAAPPRRGRWPWVLSLALLGTAGALASLAWYETVPGAKPLETSAAQKDLPAAPPPPPADSPAKRPPEPSPGVAADSAGDTSDLTLLTETLPLVPKDAPSSAPADPAPLPSPKTAPPDLSRALAADQLPQAEKTPGTGPERHGYPILAAGSGVPNADSVAVDEATDLADPAQPATQRVAVPEGRASLPPAPRPRPAEAIWVATAAAARAAAAAQSAARNPAPLPPMTAPLEVPTAPLVPPQFPLETAASAPPPNAAAAAEPNVQSAYVPPRMTEALGAVDGQTGEASKGANGDPGPLRYEQLSNELRAKIPPVRLSAHVYDPDPQRRFARINKKKVREGEEIAPGLWLETVTEDGIVLRYDDTRFRMSSF